MNEDRLREQLRSVPIPAEREVEERSWRVVRAAYEAQPTGVRRRRARRLVLLFAGAAGLLAIGLSPAGAKVGDWIEDLVDPGVRDAQPALTSLPAAGSLLVGSSQGQWVVHSDGSKRLLGDYEQASWSPNGLFVIATRGRQLTALTPSGEVRWSLSAREPVSDARWAPSGFRIAYRSGSTLRVVAGDGSGDRLLADRIASVPAAWKPISDTELETNPSGAGTHLIAFTEPNGRTDLVDADSGERSWRSKPGQVPIQLEWSGDGRVLSTLQPSGLRVFDELGFIARLPAFTEGRLTSMAAAPVGTSFALLATRRGQNGQPRSQVQLVEAAGKGPLSELFAGSGSFGPLTFSPDGRWLLLPWQSADQWLFLPTDQGTASGRIEAVEGISREFDPGGSSPLQFPRVEGWCCAP